MRGNYQYQPKNSLSTLQILNQLGNLFERYMTSKADYIIFQPLLMR